MAGAKLLLSVASPPPADSLIIEVKSKVVAVVRRGFFRFGTLFFVVMIVAAVWFFKHNKATLPTMPTNVERVQEPQKLPPATGVDFSTEVQTPLHQAQKYYGQRSGH